MYREDRQTFNSSAIPLAFILFVGVLALTLNIYVTQMVPVLVFDAEVNAHRSTLSDVREFDFAVRKAVATGEPQPIVVGDTVEYPVSLPTPPDPRFAVRTSEMENITVENFDRVCENNATDTDGGPS